MKLSAIALDTTELLLVTAHRMRQDRKPPKQVVHEGNVRRVVVKQGDRIVAGFTLTAGVVGAVIAPVLAAVGTLVAMMQDCTIEVERTPTEPSLRKESAAEAPVAVDQPGQ